MNGQLAGAITFSGLLALLMAARASPSEEIEFILQLTGLGVAAGTLFGLAIERGRPDLEWSRISAYGGAVCFVFGALIVAVVRLGSL